MNAKLTLDIVLKIVRQLFIVLGSIGTWIGVDLPPEAQQGLEGLVAALGPFILAVGMLWSWIRSVIEWFKSKK